MQCYTLLAGVERLLANAVRWVVPEGVPVEVEAAGPVGVSVFRQPSRLVVHLVNHHATASSGGHGDSAPPRRAANRSACRSHEPKVRRLWEDRRLPAEVMDRRLQVDVGSLDEYEAVAVEW